MTSRERRNGNRVAGPSADETAELLQATIRHADTKAGTLLGLAGGMATAVTGLAPASSSQAAVVALLMTLKTTALMALVPVGWHLLAAIRPRFVDRLRLTGSTDAGPHGGDDAVRELRTLRRIAVEKHLAVARSIPWLLGVGAATGAAMGLAIAGHL